MTVRETLDFAGRCQGVGFKYELPIPNTHNIWSSSFGVFSLLHHGMILSWKYFGSLSFLFTPLYKS
ncbi:hypothetical protein RchiOBHm_Chr1g0327401 [Rosa chinensis]|uniref:Uncharacterized protein n=1 Tax=Rosa chinensis TaxID=74649 RepID=A0A2P6SAK4_ROSCH|nr:hypothetical protein RchiOBHm_Chr1g0327401 [Rosa chinensis]